MAKPTRDEFTAQVKEKWPDSQFIAGDRGLYVVVKSADLAMAVQFEAMQTGLKPTGIDRRGPEDFLVRIFGFPKKRQVTHDLAGAFVDQEPSLAANQAMLQALVGKTIARAEPKGQTVVITFTDGSVLEMRLKG